MAGVAEEAGYIQVYTKDIPYGIFHEYSWYITGISETFRYMHGIYQVYTWYISVICPCHQYAWYIPTSHLMGLFRTFFYNYILGMGASRAGRAGPARSIRFGALIGAHWRRYTCSGRSGRRSQRQRCQQQCRYRPSLPPGETCFCAPRRRTPPLSTIRPRPVSQMHLVASLIHSQPTPSSSWNSDAAAAAAPPQQW